jgi:hypothetical protein
VKEVMELRMRQLTLFGARILGRGRPPIMVDTSRCKLCCYFNKADSGGDVWYTGGGRGLGCARWKDGCGGCLVAIGRVHTKLLDLQLIVKWAERKGVVSLAEFYPYAAFGGM